MPDSFTGSGMIRLQPGDSGVSYSFSLPPCSSASANDGAIPYGTSVSSVAVSAFKHPSRADATSEMVDGSSVADNVVTVTLSYPASAGPGLYHLEIVATLNDGSAMEFDFTRITARDV